MSKSIVHCLNCSGCAGWISQPKRTKVSALLAAVQKHSLRHIWETVVEFHEFEDFEISIGEFKTELMSNIFNYSGGVVSVRRQLNLFKGLACMA